MLIELYENERIYKFNIKTDFGKEDISISINTKDFGPGLDSLIYAGHQIIFAELYSKEKDIKMIIQVQGATKLRDLKTDEIYCDEIPGFMERLLREDEYLEENNIAIDYHNWYESFALFRNKDGEYEYDNVYSGTVFHVMSNSIDDLVRLIIEFYVDYIECKK